MVSLPAEQCDTEGRLDSVMPRPAQSHRRLNSRDRQHDLKRYDEWKVVFGRVAAFLQKKGRWIEDPTREQTVAMFVSATPFCHPEQVQAIRDASTQLCCPVLSTCQPEDIAALAREF